MFYWYLPLWFDYVKKNQKPRENQNKKQYSRTLAKAKIQKTSRKPKKTKKIIKKKTIFQDSCKSKKCKNPKKPRENQKKQQKQKKQYSRSLEIGSTGKSPGTLVFLVFLVFSRFFGFLHFYFCKSPGILFFLFFLFFLVFSRFFGFLLLQESWNTVVFFGFLEVF